MKKRFALALSISMIAILITAGLVNAGPAPKVDVCHLDDMGVYHLINISDNAFDTHVAHGDDAPGYPVPGMTGKKFGADCSVIDVKTLVATLTVDANGATTQSPILENGVNYEFVASGLYKYSTGVTWEADAKCSFRLVTVPPYIAGWVDGSLLNTTYGLQVSINDGLPILPLTPVGWIEGCNLDHIYTATYLGSGAQLGFNIWDSYYGDNSGFLTVKIYKYN